MNRNSDAERAGAAKPAADHDAEREHRSRARAFADEVTACETQSNRLSLARLVAFLLAGSFLATALTERTAWAFWLFVAGTAGFVAAVIAHLRVIAQLERAQIRQRVHERHLARTNEGWTAFENRGERLLPNRHPYAWDIDLVGKGSLFQRIDVTHTVQGECLLGAWLGRAADRETIAARQSAVRELAAMVEFRQELEASALAASGSEKLDARPFRELAELPSFFEAKPWLTPLIFALPLATLACYGLGERGVLAKGVWLAPLVVQIGLLWWSTRAVHRVFDLAAARQGVVESFEGMLASVERAQFQSPLLCALQQRLVVDDETPSVQMRRLKSWTSAAELRKQFLFYILVNPFTLWDLHVLRGLERWIERVGRRTTDWFLALAELEALSSLATLLYLDPAAHMPEVGPAESALEARGLEHPLLLAESRVPNDLALKGPSCALIVTGSNMAGKSTLLRALGLNVALALAGGPVCAASLRVPLVRLRASMRADDSVLEHASYFQAELQKLKSVVEDADAEPPVLFLLDELLRGTNMRARHLGARAVLLHLLKRRALGLCATHDIALSELERELPAQIENVHFTDVVEDGQMRFDYRLRAGVVRSSNALRLLALAGIDVPAEAERAMTTLADAEPIAHEPSRGERG